MDFLTKRVNVYSASDINFQSLLLSNKECINSANYKICYKYASFFLFLVSSSFYNIRSCFFFHFQKCSLLRNNSGPLIILWRWLRKINHDSTFHFLHLLHHHHQFHLNLFGCIEQVHVFREHILEGPLKAFVIRTFKKIVENTNFTNFIQLLQNFTNFLQLLKICNEENKIKYFREQLDNKICSKDKQN